jgi:hypothetical protein
MGLDASICFGCKFSFKEKTYQGCERCHIPSNNKYCSSCGSRTEQVIERPEFLDLLNIKHDISSILEEGYLILFSRVYPSHISWPEMYDGRLFAIDWDELNKKAESIKFKILNSPELRAILNAELQWLYFLNIDY